jgi:hypothetical protein
VQFWGVIPQFTLRHLEVEKEDLSNALTYREENNDLFIYLKQIYEDERIIENKIRELTIQPQIVLKFPVTESHWKNFLKKPDSPMAQSHPDKYEQAISEQVLVCQKIFLQPISVLCGGAGTGKTTVVEALISAIDKGHGTGTSFQLLAPTGKAADRLRERTGKWASTIHSFLANLGWLNSNLTFKREGGRQEAFQLLAPTGKAADRLRERTGKWASTIHSFLANLGWLNSNLTFKREGGRQEDSISTYIIDESSMLDLPLLATFLGQSIGTLSSESYLWEIRTSFLPLEQAKCLRIYWIG